MVAYTLVAPKRVDPDPVQNFGVANATAMSTSEIRNHCPGCIVPPATSGMQMTISAWARGRPLCDDRLVQTISRYLIDFTKDESCALLEEDPSFELQGQWYGGSSYGLLQVWPANAAFTLRYGVTDTARRSALRSLYDPLTEPGTKLFDPNVGVEFGAAADRAVNVLVEGQLRDFEDVCPLLQTAGPFNDCTWRRYWARRFAAFNAGSDGNSEKYTNYGLWIVNHSDQFVPITQPNP
jgi:hypothetical protein